MNPWLERLQRLKQCDLDVPPEGGTPGFPNDIAAVKVWSTVLRARLWVVADDLPREAWPTDAPVYTHAEVKILRQAGREGLASVHAAKALFAGRVLRAHEVELRHTEEGHEPSSPTAST
jgi:hypothetical protein